MNMAQTQSKAQLPMDEIKQRPDEAVQAFQRGVEMGRDYAQLAVRKIGAWAEENPGQVILAGIAAGFVLGKLLFHKPRAIAGLND